MLVIMTNIISFSIPAWHISSNYRLEYPITYPIGHMAYTGSIYMTVLLSFERYVAVCKKKLITVKKTISFMICVTLFAICFDLPKFGVYKYAKTEDGVTIGKTTELICNNIFVIVYLSVLQLCVTFIFPTFCLIVSNIFIFKEVSKQEKHDSPFLLLLLFQISLLI